MNREITKQSHPPRETRQNTHPRREKLAIYGGPKAVQAKYREKWKHVRVRDITPALPWLAVGQNTISQGLLLEQFERQFADFCDTRYSLMMNSGTAALHSAYFAVGVRPGDEVIVPTYTFFASAAPILQCGAKPIFCDIDEKTLTADPTDVERRITPRTRAICVVHLWGNPAALDRFVDIAKRHNIALIEDASHAHGAIFQGRPVGSFGDIGCFSLQGQKAVSAGEAGIAVTNNSRYYDRMLALGHCFRQSDYVTGESDIDGMNLGIKFRPHLCGIALAKSSLKRIGELNVRRRANYAILADELKDCDAVQPIETYPGAQRGGLLEFILRYHPERAGGWSCEAFCAAAIAEGARVVPDRYARQSATGRLLHEAPLFNRLEESDWAGPISLVRYERPPRDERLPVAERLADELITLPPFTKVSEEYIRQTARALKKVAEAAPHIGDLRTGQYES